jgi:hypothetical protein
VYLRFPIETLAPVHDEAFAVTEYMHGEPRRQVSVAGERWVTSLEDEDPVIGPTLAEGELPDNWELDLGEGLEEVDAVYFEELWTEALRRRQGRS